MREMLTPEGLKIEQTGGAEMNSPSDERSNGSTPSLDNEESESREEYRMSEEERNEFRNAVCEHNRKALGWNNPISQIFRRF